MHSCIISVENNNLITQPRVGHAAALEGTEHSLCGLMLIHMYIPLGVGNCYVSLIKGLLDIIHELETNIPVIFSLYPGANHQVNT